MIKQKPFMPAGRAANHCPQLVSKRKAQIDMRPIFDRFGARLAAALQGRIADLAGDVGAGVASLGAREVRGGDLSGLWGPLLVTSRHHFGTSGQSLYLVFDGRSILEQLDRTFGGAGDIGDALPEQLPRSATVLAGRLECQVLAAIASELGELDFRSGGDASGDAMATIDPDAALTALTIEVATKGREWQIGIVLDTASLPSLLAKSLSGPGMASSRGRAGIGDAPFANLPLTAGARLVDMKMPLHRIATIGPGAILPIRVARNVPLQVGDVVIARGTLGEVDDQVALQITQTFNGKEIP